MISAWKRKRLGAMFTMSIHVRQTRPGKEKEPVAVLRICEDVQKGDELVLTRRDISFLLDGCNFERRRQRKSEIHSLFERYS